MLRSLVGSEMCIRDSFITQSKVETNNAVIHKIDSECNNRRLNTQVYFVLEPSKSYFNPIEQFLDSDIDNGLENLFSLESLGIKQNEEILNTVDKCQVQLFNQNMIFKDNHYHVSLPWYEDKIELVPNNFKISLDIANSCLLYTSPS